MDDMLQKALAHAFDPSAPWDKPTVLNMLATIIRRSARYSDAPVGLAPGPLAVFVLVPLLRQAGARADPADVQRDFNSKSASLLDALLANGTGPEGVFSARCLVALMEVAGFPLTLPQCRQLLEYCATHLDMSDEPPWATWGVLAPTVDLACSVATRCAVRYSFCTPRTRTHSCSLRRSQEGRGGGGSLVCPTPES